MKKYFLIFNRYCKYLQVWRQLRKSDSLFGITKQKKPLYRCLCDLKKMNINTDMEVCVEEKVVKASVENSGDGKTGVVGTSAEDMVGIVGVGDSSAEVKAGNTGECSVANTSIVSIEGKSETGTQCGEDEFVHDESIFVWKLPEVPEKPEEKIENPISRLNRLCLNKRVALPEFKTISQEESSQMKLITIEVTAVGESERAQGPSKNAAKLEAARLLCIKLNVGLTGQVGDDGKLDCIGEKRKAEDGDINKDLKKAKLETKALKAKRPGFTDDRYNETSYYIENGLRKVYPYYFTFTTFTKGRWVGEKIIDVFAREFRAHPAEEYERCIKAGTLTVNYEKVNVDYRLKHNDLLANIVHRHEVPVTSDPITVVHMDEDIVVVNKPASIPVHPCGRYRHNTVVFILAKEYNLKNLRTIHRLDRLTSGLLLFGRSPKKARQMEHQIRNRQVQKEYVCRVEGKFPSEQVKCSEPIEVVSYKIGVCKVSPKGKVCSTTFLMLGYNPVSNTSIVLCKPHTGRMHQIRVHLQYLGYPVVNDPLYNHTVFGPEKGKGGVIGKTDEELIHDLINIHNAENWLGMDGDSELSMFKPRGDLDERLNNSKGSVSPVDEEGDPSREASPCGEDNQQHSPSRCSLGSPVSVAQGSPSTPSEGAISRGTKVTVATQTGHETPDLSFNSEKMTYDHHCYECKVRYRDPKPRDLIMYLHAWKYRGPEWEYETELPEWARVDWVEPADE